jgi:molecular chaperone DnaK
MERLLVYDLGGGTFDVSIAQVEDGVVEILSSHGDTRLGGDDFDQKLLDYVCDAFQNEHGIDLRESLTAGSRLLAAVEEAKKRLSSEPIVAIEEEFIAEKGGVSLNLSVELDRSEYEELIEPLLAKTLRCLDEALADAGVQANQIDKVLLVGGATRTPLVHHLLTSRLGRPVHSEIEPDLAVAMGAAVQAGLIAGIDVGPVLVDITPKTLGIETLGWSSGFPSEYEFSPIVERNTPLPVTRTQLYMTSHDGQKKALVRVFQGEHDDTRMNEIVGEFNINGLSDVPAGNAILVRLDLDLNGILKVTATERSTGLAKQVTIDSAAERLRQRSRVDARDRLDELFSSLDSAALLGDTMEGGSSNAAPSEEPLDAELAEALDAASALIAKSTPLESSASREDAEEMKALRADLQQAIANRSVVDIRRIVAELDDLVFYLADR